jgi:predicted Zn-dependent protease with MMP-like domain
MELAAWTAFLILISGLFFWIKRDSEISLRKLVRHNNREKIPSSIDSDWQQLTDRAGEIVQTAIAELPDDVRAEAQSVPVLFEERAENEKPDMTTLGIYRGFQASHVSQGKGPIVLYLRSIETYVGRTAGAFEDQVRRTYLHELGHHLGWGEIDVRARGL